MKFTIMLKHWTLLLFVIVLFTLVSLPAAFAKENGVLPAEADDKPHARPVYDAYGNTVQEADKRYNYLALADSFSRVQLDQNTKAIATEMLPSNPFGELQKQGTRPPGGLPLTRFEGTPEYLALKWETGIWGTGIGASGFSALDIDNDGAIEIIAGGGNGFGDNRFWYILTYSSATGGYEQEWLSESSNTLINRIVVADTTGGGDFNIYVALDDGMVQIFDATTRELIDTFSGPFGGIQDMTFADVDNDGSQEIIAVSPSGLSVHNAQTYAVEWQSASYGSFEVEVANVDSDNAPEIVTTRHVIDGMTHVLEWDYPGEFGARVRLADIDADNMSEIIAADSWDQITAYDADIQAPKWDIPTSHDIHALVVLDVDNDDVQEVIYGDGQWGSIHVINSLTLAEEWTINNPEHGITDIIFSDTDDDGVLEVLWGAGWTSTGPDYLFVGSTETHEIEWQSQDIGGPLSALDVGDIDNDGTNEIVMVSFESESGYDDGIIFVYDAETYELEWQSEPVVGGYGWVGVHALELADVDADGILEILIGTAHLYDGIIKAYDGLTHEVDWETAYYNGTHFSAIAAGDIDNDGEIEVVGGQTRDHTGAPGVYLLIFDGSSGVEEWRTTNLTYSGGVYDIDLGNFDGDSNPEILFSVSDSNAYVYDGVTQVQEWQSSFTSTRAVGGFDVDQDGEIEILVGTNNGVLYALNGQTYGQEWSDPLSTQSLNSLRLTDIDRDSETELVVADDNHLSIYDSVSRELIWESGNLGSSVARGGHLVVADIDDDTRDEVVLGSDYALSVFTYSLLPFGPSLSVDKSLAIPDETLDYTIEVANFSDASLPALITDTLPAHTLYVDGSLTGSGGSWEITGNVITWAVDLALGETASLQFATTVDSDTADGTEIVNTAVYQAGGFIDSRNATTTIDALSPTSTIGQPVAGEIVSGAAYVIAGTAHDTVSGIERVEVRINNGDWITATGTTTWELTWTLPITDAAFTIETRSVDHVGYIEADGPIVSGLVDNLSPTLVATTPTHGQTNVFAISPVMITFSEPVMSDTLEFICQDDPGDWSLQVSEDGKTITLHHAPFEHGTIYSCFVSHVEDRVGHALSPGNTPNPWAFTTVTTEFNIFLPVIVR